MPFKQIQSCSQINKTEAKEVRLQIPISHNSSLFHSFLQHKLKNTVSFSILMSMNHDNEPNCVKTVNDGEKRKSNIKMHRALFFHHCIERWLFIHLQNIIKTSSFWNFACNTAIAWPRTLHSCQPLLLIIQCYIQG